MGQWLSPGPGSRPQHAPAAAPSRQTTAKEVAQIICYGKCSPFDLCDLAISIGANGGFSTAGRAKRRSDRFFDGV